MTHYPTRRSSSSPSSVSWWPNRHGPSLETSTTVGLHIKRLTHEHFSGGQLTVVCTASIDSTHQRSSTAKAFMDRARQTGPLVNPLRPSTLSTQPTAAADKRRSAQQTTGQSLIITNHCLLSSPSLYHTTSFVRQPFFLILW